MKTSDVHWEYDGFGPIRVQIQTGQLPPQDHRRHLEKQTLDLQSAVAAGTKFFVVLDARTHEMASPEIRRMQADWLRENTAAFQATCLGIAFVIKNRLVRGGMTAVFWLTSSPVPYTVHATLDEAIAHAIAVCEKAGLQVPAAARDNPAAAVEKAYQASLRPAV